MVNIGHTLVIMTSLAAPAPDEWRDNLADRGVSFEASLIADWSWNLRGGVSTNGDNFRHLFDFNVTFDLEKIAGLEGATVFFDYYNHHGPDASADLTGDAQAFDNIDADGRSQVAELWYEQWLADDRLRFKVGKVDANSEFSAIEHAGEFVNSSAGYSPTNPLFPSYPDPAMSVNVFAYPTDAVYLGVGIYDGALQEGILTGKRGAETFFGDPGDLYVVGEAGYAWATGRVGIGAWGHTGTFPGGDGTQGLYLFVEQQFTDDVGAFAQLGWSDEDDVEIDLHLGAGVAWSGPIPGRDDDVAGAMASYVHFSDEMGFTDDDELAIETFYKVQVTDHLAIKPDLQYIINPGGSGLRDALAATLRVEVTY